MAEVYTTWKPLPVEMLHHIFLSATETDLCTFALVCKAWLHPAQSLLYSSINIETQSRLQKFYNTVKNNAHLGKMVKSFEMQSFFYDFVDMDARKLAKKETYNILTALWSTYLPKLEILREQALWSYIPVLDALMDSQLRHLRFLRPPTLLGEKDEVIAYETCALLMKDRLENLLISDDYNFTDKLLSDRIIFDRLYNKLDRFHKLNEIGIRRKTDNGIQLLENTVETCKLLKKVAFNFRPNNSASQNKDISMGDISKFIPRPNVTTLTSNINKFFDSKLLYYIIHKFPQLKSLSLSVLATYPCKLNDQLLSQLLHYLTKIDSFSVSGFSVDHDTIIKTFGSFWGATSTHASQYLKYCCSEAVEGEFLVLHKNSTSITYSSLNPQWLHVDFLKKNGKFVYGLQISFSMHNHFTADRCILPDNFITHTFTHCPYIKYLNLEQCTLKQVTHIEDLEKNTSLEQLSLEKCEIHADVLEQWSSVLPKIKRLELYDCRFFGYQTEDSNLNAFQVIKMLQTKISLITLGVFAGDSHYIKVYAVGEEKFYYYLANLSKNDKQTMISSEQEYLDANKYERVYICCQTNPIFEIQMIE